MKNKKILIPLLIVFVVSVLFIINYANKKESTVESKPTLTPVSRIADFNEVVPGKTSIEKINELLGSPLSTISLNNIDTSMYKSSNQYRTHEVVSENGIVKLIIEEVVDNSKNSETIKKIYGVAPEVLYEQLPSSVFNLYVYPENGIAYLGHESGNAILQIWYFEPTTIQDFISKWASGFSKQKTKEIPQY